MGDREYILPLTLGVVFAVALHIFCLPLAARALAVGERPRPDLRVSVVQAPRQAMAGGTVDVSFTVVNAGAVAARYGWADRVYLSADATLSADDRLLATRDSTTPLRPGEWYEAVAAVPLPQRVQGERYLIVKADARNRVLESTGQDNDTAAAALEIVVPPRPDLVAKAITMPDRVEVGKPFELELEIANDGATPTGDSGWRDTLYLSKDQHVDAGDTVLATIRQNQPLDAGVRYRCAPPKLAIPESHTGAGYLILRTDVEDEIEEYPNEANNTLAVPVVASAGWLSRSADPVEQSATPPTPQKPTPAVVLEPKVEEDIPLGRDDADSLAVAWISHDAFLKLQARAGPAVQPAVQKEAEPLPDARVEPDPTPPQPPTPPESTPQRAAAQPTPAPEDAETAVAEQIEAHAPEPDPAPPIARVEARAPTEAVAEPTRQPLAVAPVPPATNVLPADQSPATSDRPGAGLPAEQEPAKPPRVIAADPQLDGPAATEDATSLDERDRAKAAGGDAPQPTPAQQVEARTTLPHPLGKPALMVPAEAPKTTAGEPTSQRPATTPAPDPDGRPATADPVEGTDAESPTAAKTTAKDDQTRPAPSTEGEADSQPAPRQPPARPTVVPKREKESDPFDLTGAMRVVPGEVVVGRGIEIQTVKPTFGIATRVSVLPGNPTAKIRFNRKGRVIKAWMIKSSGYPSVDVPIIASIYKWRAKGKKLAELEGPFEVEMHLILVPLW